MRLLSFVQTMMTVVAVSAMGAAQTTSPSPPASQAASGEEQGGTKVGVIDIDRVAAESSPGKALIERLKQENEKINAGRVQREKELADLQSKMTSEILSAEARDRLNREIERKRTEAQRWLEDMNRGFQETQQMAETQFQTQLRPIVEKVAKEHGFGLIFRAAPTTTMVLNPGLDITPLVVEAFNQATAPRSGDNKQ